MLKKLRDIYSNQSGAVEMTSLVLMSWIVIMLLTAGVDIFFMVSRFITVSNVTQSAVEMMKDEGRFTDGPLSIEAWLMHELDERGVPQNDVRIVEATREEALRGEPVHLHVRARYTLRSFRPLGMSEDRLTMTWDVRKTGISRKHIRTLDVPI